MGFVAALQAGLGQWAKQVPVAQKVRDGVSKASRETFRKAGRAVVPISALIAKGFLKKLSGAGLDEWMDAIRGNEEPSEGVASSSSQTNATRDEAIDEFFKVSLEEHAKHMRAVDDFKMAASDLLTYLEANAKARLPVFVLIDELDRCRPNYAIELLEGVKHLFDVRGICFCISTNLDQLCESVKGVYGAGFDSHKYLKRFFAFEYVLPDPSDHAFARLLVPHSLIARRTKIVSGLSDWSSTQSPTEETIAKVFHFVARGFRLDLRSQRQVFDTADAASVGLGPDKPVHILYLFALAALRHLDRGAFHRLQAGGGDEQVRNRLSVLIDPDCTHPYVVVVRSDNSIHGERRSTQIRLGELLNNYIQLAVRDLKDIREQYYERSSDQYPRSIERSVAEEMPSSFYPQQEYPPSIRLYPDLVRTAGQLSTTGDG